MKVLVTNQCAWNKGDRAVLYVLVNELLRQGVEHVTVSTTGVGYWAAQQVFPPDRVSFIPIGLSSPVPNRTQPGLIFKCYRRGIQKIKQMIHFSLVRRALVDGRNPSYLKFLTSKPYWDALQKADLVISTGGHRVTTLLMKDAVGEPMFDLALACVLKKRLVLWSQSVGPLEFHEKVNRQMVQRMLDHCWRIMVRDQASYEVLADMGTSPSKISSTPESVFAVNDLVSEVVAPSQREMVLGVSVYTSGHAIKSSLDKYIDYMSKIIGHAIGAGYRVLVMPMMLAGDERACIDRICARVAKPDKCVVREGFPETPDHVREVSGMRCFLGHKTHSIVFALAVGTPVVAISYHPKTNDFMKQFGLEQYCVNDRDLDPAEVIRVFDEIQQHLDEVSQQQRDIARELGDKVRHDVETLISDARASRSI